MSCCRNLFSNLISAIRTGLFPASIFCAGRFFCYCPVIICMTCCMYDRLFGTDLIPAFAITVHFSAFAAGPEFNISVFRAACLFCFSLCQVMDVRKLWDRPLLCMTRVVSAGPGLQALFVLCRFAHYGPF